MGRAPRTKETLPDFLKWCRVTRHPLVFHGLTGSQRTPGKWGVTSFILFAKLKALKGILKTWNKEVFGKVETNKKDALREVIYWDDLEKERDMNLEEVKGHVKARVDFKRWALVEEISWRQKSRETWLKEGDKNTRFFHRTVNAHKRRNYVKSISINCRKLEKEADIKDGLVAAF